MPTVDLSSYHQPNSTGADGTKFDNLIDAVQAALNGLDKNNLVANAGILGSQLGIVYAPYTPTWTASGVAPAIGNATVIAQYAQLGKLVHAYGSIVFGAGSTFGTGSYKFALPVTASANAIIVGTAGQGFLQDSSANFYLQGSFYIPAGGTTMSELHGATYAGTATLIGQTAPWTWATGDTIAWNILYEAA